MVLHSLLADQLASTSNLLRSPTVAASRSRRPSLIERTSQPRLRRCAASSSGSGDTGSSSSSSSSGRRAREVAAMSTATTAADASTAASAAAAAAVEGAATASGSTNGSADGADTCSPFIRQHLRKLKAYTPIEPFEVLSARLGRKPWEIVKLDANENPYGPPPEVLQALGAMQFPHIYPDPETRQLRAALAKDTGVPAEHILVGCGADELIDLLMRCCLELGDSIIDCPPTFTMYAFDADVNGGQVIKVPRNPDDFSLDLPAIKIAVEKHRPKMIFLTSPNNPDGSVTSVEHVLEVLALDPNLLVVLDEAYVEFSSLPSLMPLVQHHPNLVVLRTFSKRAGLAGLRVGYGAFPLGLVEYLWRAKQPYNVSVAAETAACAALSNPSYLEEVRKALVGERERLFGLLQTVPFLKPYPSHANFLLCHVAKPWEALQVKQVLSTYGVMVRHYAKPELSGYVRISVGKPEHTDALMRALRDMVEKGPPQQS